MEGLFSFLENNSIYIVMLINLVVWGGIFFYLFSLDKRLKDIHKEMEETGE